MRLLFINGTVLRHLLSHDVLVLGPEPSRQAEIRQQTCWIVDSAVASVVVAAPVVGALSFFVEASIPRHN
jgi:hypothetical protein